MILLLLVLLILSDHFLFLFLTTFSSFCLFRARLLVFFLSLSIFLPIICLGSLIHSHKFNSLDLYPLLFSWVPVYFQQWSVAYPYPFLLCLLVESFTMNWISLSHSSISLGYSKLDLKVTAISPRAVEDPHNAFLQIRQSHSLTWNTVLPKTIDNNFHHAMIYL